MAHSSTRPSGTRCSISANLGASYNRDVMDLSGIQPQIVISVVLIVSAAAVALLVDHLKRRNEQLQVALAELRLHQQPQAALAGPTRRPAPASAPAPAPPVTARAEAKPAPAPQRPTAAA